MSNSPAIVLSCLLASLLLGCATTSPIDSAPPQEQVTSGHPAADKDAWAIPKRPADELTRAKSLEAMNALFRETYSHARNVVQAYNDVVILLRFSAATLLLNGNPVETVRVLPSRYHDLRYASHVPFAIYLRLAPNCGNVWSGADAGWVKRYMAAMDSALPTFATLSLSAEQVSRLLRLVQNAQRLLMDAIAKGAISCEALFAYARSSSRDAEQNIFDAGVAQVDGLHEQLLKWRATIRDADWKRLHFVVRGPQQPRGGHGSVVYLAAVVQDAGDARGYIGESDRAVYREDTSLPSGIQASPWEADLQLLAAVGLDARASTALFGDPDRLAVDVAAQGARARVRQLDLSAVRVPRCRWERRHRSC